MIGQIWKDGDVRRRLVLMGRGLDGYLISVHWHCVVLKARGGRSLTVCGGYGEGETPLPFPNRAVKPLSADGTWLARAWESRSPPVFSSEAGRRASGLFRCKEEVLVESRAGLLRMPVSPARLLLAFPVVEYWAGTTHEDPLTLHVASTPLVTIAVMN